MATLYNTGVNCMPTDKELGELFGNRGDMFLTKVPAKIMSQRGYGNMRSKYPIDPSKDINATYPDYKLVKGTFDNVGMDFPKGAGGVGDNPMWADGTYEEMKANFTKQAEAQNDVRHLIPDLEDQRLKQYDLANFTGGTAQQNKLDFMLKEAMTEEQRIKNYQKMDTIMKEFPNLSREDASKIVADEAVRERIRLLEKRGITMSDLMANDVAVNVVRMGHPDQALDEARGGIRTTRDVGTQTPAEPDGMAGYRWSRDIASTYPYWKDTSRSNVSAPSVPHSPEGKAKWEEIQLLTKNSAPGGEYRRQFLEREPFVPEPALPVRPVRAVAGSLQGVGSAPAPLPARGNAGGGGGGGGIRPREFDYDASSRFGANLLMRNTGFNPPPLARRIGGAGSRMPSSQAPAPAPVLPPVMREAMADFAHRRAEAGNFAGMTREQEYAERHRLRRLDMEAEQARMNARRGRGGRR